MEIDNNQADAVKSDDATNLCSSCGRVIPTKSQVVKILLDDIENEGAIFKALREHKVL